MNEQPLQTPLEESSGAPDIWRDEVQARLERYKRRRGRRIEGAFTMRFPFPPEDTPTPDVVEEDGEVAMEPRGFSDHVAAPQTVEAAPALTEATVALAEEAETREPSAEEAAPLASPIVASTLPAKDPEPEEEPRLIELPPRPLPRRKVIAFPSPSYAQGELNRRIADPVQPEQLRILDVPEELQAMPATPFLQGLLDPSPTPAPEVHADESELPCATLAAPRRISAALIDAGVTFAGAAAFAAAASRFLPGLPPMKFLIAGAVAISVLLWASYEYLFLTYMGRTPGMRAMHVRLQTFEGRFPNFRQRQLRVIGLYLSVFSLGMGVLWYLVDVESLCWHDRISQTFPAADKS